ncbi:MAG: helix-turn-helix domain-containing protein [Peptococcaceae bacterium]|nr:helix-turn-helix domain-containing protein [Peptococcaceae bacterium]
MAKPLPPCISRKHPGDTVELISSLARNMTDSQIAKHLNDSGHRTPENKLFTTASFSWLRYRYRIKGPAHDGLTVKETANHFGVSTHVVYYWLDHGLLKGTKLAPGRPWNISIDDDTEKTLSAWVKKSKRISSCQCSKA